MKKAISLLAAFALVFTMGIATFAADDITGTANALPEMRSARASISGDDITIPKSELFIVNNGKIGGVYEKLDPDTEYKFDIYYNAKINSGTSEPEDWIGDAADLSAAVKAGTDLVRLTAKELAGGEIRLRTVKGSTHVQSARIKSSGRGEAETYQLVIKTRASYGTKVNDVEYSLTPHNVDTGKTGYVLTEGTTVGFEVGYEKIPDDDLDIEEDGYIYISNDYPVITKDQFSDLAKNVNYKAVNFEADDGGWRYTGRVSGMKDTNFFYDYDFITEIMDMFPDQDYKFLNFRGGVNFPSAGEMRIDVDDVVDSFGVNTMYTYLYRNGKLTQIDTSFDSSSREIVFRTNYLGNFVITDKEITDTSIIEGGTGEEPGEPEEPEEPDEPGEDNGTNNPDTGADRAMDLAVTLGLVSLATAGALSRKKRK